MQVMYSYFTRIDFLYTHLISLIPGAYRKLRSSSFYSFAFGILLPNALHLVSFRGEQLRFAHKSGYWMALFINLRNHITVTAALFLSCICVFFVKRKPKEQQKLKCNLRMKKRYLHTPKLKKKIFCSKRVQNL
jgi:hypothetical protein